MTQAQSRSANDDNSVYILITQCLQNGFFLSNENRLSLPADIVKNMLVGDQKDIELDNDFYQPEHTKRLIPKSILKNGPLYQFLHSVVTTHNDPLHVIHIKDWHEQSDRYDEERRRYGAHCEAGTWEAQEIDGLERYLAPWKETGQNSLTGTGDALSLNGYMVPSEKTTFYEVRSDSVFDFKPATSLTLHPSYQELAAGKKQASQLEILLDKLIGFGEEKKRVSLVVIGVYSDIKIKTLLVSLRSRYDIENLLVSDVLTAAPSLERHLSGLDFADKVLNVEIMHSLNELVKVLNPNLDQEPPVPQSITANHPDFRRYRTYYLDKQNLLAFQDQKLVEYLEMTRERSAKVYQRIFDTNQTLILFGFILMLITIVMSVLKFLYPMNFSTEVIVIIGGISLTQLLVGFIYNPLSNLQENLNNLVRLRNYMETYSMVTGLFRHHFTSVENLYGKDQKGLETIKLEDQMRIIQSVAQQMAVNFRDISLGKEISQQAAQLLAHQPANETIPTPPTNQLNQPVTPPAVSPSPAPVQSPVPPPTAPLPPDGGQGVG